MIRHHHKWEGGPMVAVVAVDAFVLMLVVVVLENDSFEFVFLFVVRFLLEFFLLFGRQLVFVFGTDGIRRCGRDFYSVGLFSVA